MKLASLIQDGAVFQRDVPIVVWGWSIPRSHLLAEFHGVTLHTAAARDGRFEFRFPPQEAGGPFELKVGTTDGRDRATVRDILIGEVWLASGQSNMEFPLKTFYTGDPLSQLEQYLDEGGDDPYLRMATVRRQSLGTQETEVTTSWKCSNAENAPDFSAVAAWFALALRRRLKVPVGILHSSWGGTYVHSWMSREALMRLDCTRSAVLAQDAFYQRSGNWQNAELDLTEKGQDAYGAPVDFSKITHTDIGNRGVEMGWAAADFDDADWQRMVIPGDWIKQGVNGNGATWVRRRVEIPQSWCGKKLVLHLGGIDKHDITYFNGVEVGRTGKDFETGVWCAPRKYEISAGLVHPGSNVIAIRGFSFCYDAGFGGNDGLYYIAPAENPGERLPLSGPWKARAEYRLEVHLPPGPAAGSTLPDYIPEGARPFNQNQQHCLYDGMIAPLMPYGIRGAIWYQGENDAGHLPQDYLARLKQMVADWRYRWGQGDFPFYCVQIANFHASNPAGWLSVQNDLFLAGREIPNAGVIAATDIGEANDIHPHDKRAFGARLASLALAKTYRCVDVVPQGPTPREILPMGDGVLLLKLEHADGLCYQIRNPETGESRENRPLSGFEIADYEGHFFPARAELRGDGTILLSCPEKVKAPCHVRYNWNVCPECCVKNGSGLPMPTFNTYLK